MINFQRPDALPAQIFGGGVELDPHPVQTIAGRLIPGMVYSTAELTELTRLSREGILLPIPTVQQLGRISINSEMGCWELSVYDDKKNRARYGRMSVQGIHNPSSVAHRSMFMVFYGEDSLPNGPADFLDHLCENKSCCYPRHLEVVSCAVNTLRGREPRAAGQLAIEY